MHVAEVRRKLLVRKWGCVDYESTYAKMRQVTAAFTPGQPDEFWVLEHYPVYTQGYSCSDQPLTRSEIPVFATDRGGQMTYHGPGQLVIYLLVDLKQPQLGIRNLVSTIEESILELLESYRLHARTIAGEPGVYVDDCKIASLGIRVSKGRSYHGMSLNVDMDTTPFGQIVVCGKAGLKVTTLQELGIEENIERVGARCVKILAARMSYAQIEAANSSLTELS